MHTTRTLVLGIGNTLLTDEGAGVHAVHRLEAQADPRDAVDFLDGGTLSFTLAGPIAAADSLIVIDTAELHRTPGSVETFVGDEMDHFLGTHPKRSVHEVGLLDLMQIARLTGCLPVRRALIGIQPDSVDWGEQPSAGVDAAIDVACECARALIERWRA